MVPDTAENHLRLRLLDGFRLEDAGRGVLVPRAEQRLVALLGVRGSCSRTELAGLLWPDVAEGHAQASLRTALWRLRETSAALVKREPDTLAIGPQVAVDVSIFVAAAREALGPTSAVPAAALLIGAGALLPGWYDDWVLFERERLRQLQMHALEALSVRLCAARRYSEAIEAALNAMRLEPLRETATRALIAVHLAEHNVVEAARRYQIFRDVLARELGIEPSPALRHLVEHALRSTGDGAVTAL
jgi:DNA-binding SARP family transcriptional activator